MTTKLYTFDAEDTSIQQDATIYTTDDLDSVAQAANGNGTFSDFKIVGWQIGEMWDCWIKTGTPDIAKDGYQYYVEDGETIKCRVAKPGEHPGGNVYWLTPVDPVYVPILEAITVKPPAKKYLRLSVYMSSHIQSLLERLMEKTEENSSRLINRLIADEYVRQQNHDA